MVFLPWRYLVPPALVLLGAGLFILYKDWERKRNFEASYLEWEIRRLVQSGEEEKAKKLIEEGLKKGSAFKPLILSYALDGKEDSKKLLEIISSLKDDQIKSLYIERLAFAYYKEGQKEKALGVLNSIGKENFNYYSAQLLKAQMLLDSNRKEEAKKVLESVLKEAKGTYWSNLAQALLMEM
jgi:predicted negative regulator of RcsB-dependent stress response